MRTLRRTPRRRDRGEPWSGAATSGGLPTAATSSGLPPAGPGARTTTTPRPSGGHPPAPGARPAALIAVGAAVVAVLVGTLGGSLRGDAGTGQVVSGVLAVELAASGDQRQLTAGDALPDDADLLAVGGPATIRQAAGELTLAEGTLVSIDAGQLTLQRGSVLVRADGAVPLQVAAVALRGRGTWRVDLGPSPRIATYRGRVQADDGARSLPLSRYEQIDLRGGGLDGSSVPLRYDGDHPWDQQELVDALATDRLAARLSASFAATHGTRAHPTGFYASFVVPDTPVLDHLDQLAPRRRSGMVGPPAPVLIGMLVTDALVLEGGFLPGRAVSRVVELRRGGASWGLVLLRHDLGPSSLRAAADRALERAASDDEVPATRQGGDGAGAAASPSPANGDGPDGGTTAPSAGDGEGTSPRGSSPADPGTTSPTPSPVPSSPDEGPLGPLGGLVGDPTGGFDDLLGDAADELLGAASGPAVSDGGRVGRRVKRTATWRPTSGPRRGAVRLAGGSRAG
jgi:hypothetical protein